MPQPRKKILINSRNRPLEVAQASSTAQQQRATPAPIEAPAPQQWAITLGGLYTHRDVETAGRLPTIGADYSPTDRLTLHAMVPYAFDKQITAYAAFVLTF